jgi:chromosome segregation ATPase
MAEIAIKQEPKVKVRPSMMYKNNKSIEDEELELEEMQTQAAQAADEEYEQAEQAIAEHDANLGGEEKTFKKRYGDLRRHSQKQKEEYESRLDALEKQLNAASKNTMELPKTEAEINAWASEYPDVAAIVETIASKKAKEQQQHLEDRMKEIDDLQSAATRERAEAELLKLHPDFSDIRDDDSFHDWADEQPQWVQKALYENDADARSAGRAIDLYKADMGLTKKKRTPSNKDAAMDVSVRGQTQVPKGNTGTVRESDVSRMSDVEYEKNADAIALAMQEGRFIYDISGK